MSIELPRNMQPWSRWHPITITSPSGRQRFVCLICGRLSIAPDSTCLVTGADGELVDLCTPKEAAVNLRREESKEVRTRAKQWRVENQLREPMHRDCPYCHGFGCNVCMTMVTRGLGARTLG